MKLRGTLLLPLLLTVVAAAVADGAACRSLLDEFVAHSSVEAVPYTGNNTMVFFLHIPRTAGRTFYTCLLQQGTAVGRRCNKKYDQRINGTGLSDCYLLSSHDDFSVMAQLPQNTAVVSQLRDPVQRVLSAYEFAIEGAALKVWQLTPKAQLHNRTRTQAAGNHTRQRGGSGNTTRGAHTADVWPWSHLIPFLVNDITPKIAAVRAQPVLPGGVWTEHRTINGSRYYYNEASNTSQWDLTEEERQNLAPNLDPYNNDLAMPLQEFIRTPIATELLHNGELLQVLGLTNYSTWPKAAEMRSCMLKHKDIAEELLQMGLRRIERFTHVGTIDRLNSSIEAAAAALNMPLDGPAHVPKPRNKTTKGPAAASVNGTVTTAQVEGQDASNGQGQGMLGKLRSIWNKLVHRGGADVLSDLVIPGSGADSEGAPEHTDVLRRRQLKGAESITAEHKGESKANDTPATLGEVYHRCAAKARASNKGIKDNSLVHLRGNDRRQVYFDKEDRRMIPQEVLDEIRELNSLDVRLYEHALRLLERRRQQLSDAGVLQPLSEAPAPSSSSDDDDDDEYDDGEEDDYDMDWDEGSFNYDLEEGQVYYDLEEGQEDASSDTDPLV